MLASAPSPWSLRIAERWCERFLDRGCRWPWLKLDEPIDSVQAQSSCRKSVGGAPLNLAAIEAGVGNRDDVIGTVPCMFGRGISLVIPRGIPLVVCWRVD